MAFLVKPIPVHYLRSHDERNDMKKSTTLLALFTLTMVLLTSLNTWAYHAVLDNAEVLEPGHFKATGALQAITDNGGLNASGIFDAGIQQDFGLRGVAGFGETDYYVGGFVKWVPIPDVDNQPAVGLNAGITYAKWMRDVKDTVFRFEPLVSKRFAVETANVTPYASLPLGIRMRSSNYSNDSTRLEVQLAVGGQLQLEQWKNLQFIAEIGLDLDEAFSYVTAGAIMYFDTENGFSLN